MPACPGTFRICRYRSEHPTGTDEIQWGPESIYWDGLPAIILNLRVFMTIKNEITGEIIELERQFGLSDRPVYNMHPDRYVHLITRHINLVITRTSHLNGPICIAPKISSVSVNKDNFSC